MRKLSLFLNQRGQWRKWKHCREEEIGRVCVLCHSWTSCSAYPHLLYILFFWVARLYFQPKQTAPWLIHDRGAGHNKKFMTYTKMCTRCISWNSYCRWGFFCWSSLTNSRKNKRREVLNWPSIINDTACVSRVAAADGRKMTPRLNGQDKAKESHTQTHTKEELEV